MYRVMYRLKGEQDWQFHIQLPTYGAAKDRAMLLSFHKGDMLDIQVVSVQARGDKPEDVEFKEVLEL